MARHMVFFGVFARSFCDGRLPTCEVRSLWTEAFLLDDGGGPPGSGRLAARRGAFRGLRTFNMAAMALQLLPVQLPPIMGRNHYI